MSVLWNQKNEVLQCPGFKLSIEECSVHFYNIQPDLYELNQVDTFAK